ncbi:MAG: NADP-dependent oxidoreductase [Bacteroidetes bacterium]|nr:NADP-dependent oxidoreductase [Bacteroidota bacterium]
MKAGLIYSFGAPEVIKISEIGAPQLRPGCVLIKVLSSSINLMDFELRKGAFKNNFGNEFPLVLGYDIAGIIVENGAGATKFEIGDPVFCRLNDSTPGAYAQFAVVPEETIALKPSNISFYEASTIPMAGLTALQALRDMAGLKEGQSVLINGATTGIGHFAVQIANVFGAEVTAVCNLKHQNLIDELNPHEIIDINSDWFNMKGQYDVVFDLEGNNNFLKSMHLMKSDGVYLANQYYKTDTFHSFISIIIPGNNPKAVLTIPSGKDLEILAALVKTDMLIPWVEAVFPLDAITHAHNFAETTSYKGKIAIDIGD